MAGRTTSDTSVGNTSKTLKETVADSEFLRSTPFWVPSLLLVGLFIYGSIGWNAVISLTDSSGFGAVDYSQLDLSQYGRALNDPELLTALWNTVVLLVVFTVVCLVIGLVLALLLDREVRFRRSIRTIYLLPFSLAFVVTAQIWLWLYNFKFGLVNTGLAMLGLPKQDWIGNPSLVLGAVIVALVWQFSGYAMVVYLAGLRSIPDDQFEAARVDGASTLRMYWRVIIPQLQASTASAAVVLMVFALKAFDFLYSMFGGYRPRKGADILATKMVREAFKLREWGYGAAIAIIMFLLALAIISPYLYSQYKRGDL
jgi:glucose/mannose transport system permease protein